MMFQKRHYEAIAAGLFALRQEGWDELLRPVEGALIALFCEDNPLFDPIRFTDAAREGKVRYRSRARSEWTRARRRAIREALDRSGADGRPVEAILELIGESPIRAPAPRDGAAPPA